MLYMCELPPLYEVLVLFIKWGNWVTECWLPTGNAAGKLWVWILTHKISRASVSDHRSKLPLYLHCERSGFWQEATVVDQRGPLTTWHCSHQEVGVCEPSLWIQAGSVTTLINKIWQKWYVPVSIFYNTGILHFLFLEHSLLGFSVKKANMPHKEFIQE